MKVYGQLESAQPENLSADPSVTPWGRFYFHTSLFVMKVWTSLGWATVPARRVNGSRAAPTSIVLATGITILQDGSDQLHFVQGPALGGTIAASPAISAGKYVGQKLTLKGRSDANFLIIPDGAGTSQNGDRLLAADSTITYTWDGTNWSEDSYR